MSVNSHLLNALRYIEAVYDISVAEINNDKDAQNVIEDFLINRSDDKLVGYIHEYRMETSDTYKLKYLKKQAKLEERKKLHSEQQRKQQGALYRGAKPIDLSELESTNSAQKTYRGAVVEKDESMVDKKKKTILYRGQEVSDD